MNSTYQNTTSSFLKQLGWWICFLICAFYAIYAFSLGIIEILSLLNITEDAPYRAAPLMFILHALLGSMALISGILQFNRRILTKKRHIHRSLGRMHVGAIWISSASGLWITTSFDVSIAAKVAFGVLAILWFSTTTIAFLRIRKRNIKEHREWMIRSFALSFFFVTGSFWMPGLASTSLPQAIAYPLAVFLSWGLNLIVAEWWIRRTRSRVSERELAHVWNDTTTQSASVQSTR